MNSFGRRLEKLEAGKGCRDEANFVHWGWQADKVTGLRCNDRVCKRLPDEDFEDFVQRAMQNFAESMRLGTVEWLEPLSEAAYEGLGDVEV